MGLENGGAQMAENTSGRGKAAVLPDQLRGWNWGAFLLNVLWGIGNSTFIALLMFVLIRRARPVRAVYPAGVACRRIGFLRADAM